MLQRPQIDFDLQYTRVKVCPVANVFHPYAIGFGLPLTCCLFSGAVCVLELADADCRRDAVILDANV